MIESIDGLGVRTRRIRRAIHRDARIISRSETSGDVRIGSRRKVSVVTNGVVKHAIANVEATGYLDSAGCVRPVDDVSVLGYSDHSLCCIR